MAIRKEIYRIFNSNVPCLEELERTLHVYKLESGWAADMFEYNGMPLTYSTRGFRTWHDLMDAFKRHRPNYELRFLKEVEE